MLDWDSTRVHKRHPVLYVDDDPSNCLVFESQFGDDFEVLVASGGEEALSILETTRISVLVTDQRMPGMSGVDLCERVREAHPSVRRMLITAYSDQFTAIEAINRGGVQVYIVKPWRAEQVIAELRGAIYASELESTARELTVALAERERMLAIDSIRRGILHDISSPTGTASLAREELSLFVEGLIGRIPEEELRGAMELLSVLESALAHLADLQRSFREGPRTYEHRPRPQRLRELLDTVCTLVGVDPDIGLEVDCEEDLVVVVDQLGFCRVLVNLVTNARQAISGAGRRSGHVSIAGRRSGEQVVLRVCDDGPGVSEVDRERIFEAAYTTREASGGKGLGLAVSRELVERDGGSLRCVMPSEGCATCFELRVRRAPIEAGGEAGPGGRDTTGPAPGSTGAPGQGCGGGR